MFTNCFIMDQVQWPGAGGEDKIAMIPNPIRVQFSKGANLHKYVIT